MHLIQLLLPLYDNQGVALAAPLFFEVREELTARFGGLTTYTRAPASGIWQEGGNAPVRDDLVVYEVMAEKIDARWWHDYRKTLETRFRQDTLVVRAHQIRML